MAKVVATMRGYLDLVLREAGEVFHIADELWADEKRRPRWCREVGAEEAPAEDGEGGEGGEGEGGEDNGDKPEADAGKPKGKGGRKPKVKPETVQAQTAEPFADAPAPVRVKNEVNDATGGTQPDWLPPSGKPAAVND